MKIDWFSYVILGAYAALVVALVRYEQSKPDYVRAPAWSPTWPAYVVTAEPCTIGDIVGFEQNQQCVMRVCIGNGRWSGHGKWESVP